MFERAKAVTRSRRWTTAGGLAVLIAFSPAAAGCEPWTGTTTAEGGPVLPPEEQLAIDCSSSGTPDKNKVIQVGRQVRILKLHVKGTDYNDSWRVQLFPGESDLNISDPEGQPPEARISPAELSRSEPSAVALTHGGMSVLRNKTDQPLPSLPPGPLEAPSTGPSAPREYQLYNFSFTLSCIAPEGAVQLQQ
jgi:hypothetical protein